MAVELLKNESELLAKIAGGDEYAFRVVYETYYDKIYKFAYRLILSDSLAQEVVQESMLYIWQMGRKLNTINHLESFLKTIAKRNAIALFRRKAIEDKAEKELAKGYNESHNETEEGILLREARKVLEEGVRLLPKQQQQVYQLCQQQGLKYEEAARELHISHGTVQTHMKLALKFLRNHIRQHSDLVVLIIIFKLL